MKLFVATVCCVFLAACASKPKKEYEWINPAGSVASPEEVQSMKNECEYDKKIKEASKLMGLAISVGRYETKYGPKKSDEYTKQSASLISGARSCIYEKGFKSRVKQS